MKSILISTLFLLLFGLGSTQATIERFDFTGAVDEQRYKDLAEQLRCLVCQNESLLGSNAELAQDLRDEVYQMMARGQTDAQIIDFLVSRYGDFVLYNPPLRPSTYLLWFGPFILLIIAIFVLYRSILKRSRAPETKLTEDEQVRIAQALDQTSSGRDEN